MKGDMYKCDRCGTFYETLTAQYCVTIYLPGPMINTVNSTPNPSSKCETTDGVGEYAQLLSRYKDLCYPSSQDLSANGSKREHIYSYTIYVCIECAHELQERTHNANMQYRKWIWDWLMEPNPLRTPEKLVRPTENLILDIDDKSY